MRLINTFDTEKQAYAFYSFLLKEGIKNIYESHIDGKTGKKNYHLWIFDEEDFQTASDWLVQYKESPEDPKFQDSESPLSLSQKDTEVTIQEEPQWQSAPSSVQSPRVDIKIRAFHVTFTHLILFICAALFLWNNVQKQHIETMQGPVAALFAHTAIEKELLFDYPLSFAAVDEVVDTYATKDVQDIEQIPAPMKEALESTENIPSYRGLLSLGQGNQGPLFEKIRQGQVWRLFTPCLLHFDFLHILFNMAWLWILGKQIEERLRWKKMGLLILAIGIVSNTAQYLMSGPSFLGFSGVIIGMAGFIWMRQFLAPWEGYHLSRVILLFLLLFVLAMVALGILAMTLKAFSLLEITPVIANTAHVVGGLCGIALGRLSFFSRGKSL